jgi:hypothetical protein
MNIHGKEIKIGDEMRIETHGISQEIVVTGFGRRNDSDIVRYEYSSEIGPVSSWVYVDECHIVVVYRQ